MASRIRMLGLQALVVGALACQSTVPPEPGDQADLASVTLRACSGPATSLSADAKAGLQPRSTQHPDHRWADIAESTPGGFAGFLLRDGEPVLMLARPEEAAAAKAALSPRFPDFPIAESTVERARWDFAQLVDWYDFLSQKTELWTLNVTMGDKSEGDNRVVFGVADRVSLRRVQSLLVSVPIPCDLVLLKIQPPAELR